MNWLEKYQYYMRRTRLLGITGAVLVLVSIVVETYNLIGIALSTEAESAPPDLFSILGQAFLLALCLATVFGTRLWILVLRPNRPYWQYWISYLIAVGTAFAFAWWHAWSEIFFPAQAECGISRAGQICFGIYDFSRTDWVVVSTVLFCYLSIIRTALTATYAVLVKKTSELNPHSR